MVGPASPVVRRALGLGVLLTFAALPARAGSTADPAGDAVVVAVIDGAISPYHTDLAAGAMPAGSQPPDGPPHTWLPGFGDPGGFTTYEELPLTLRPDQPDADVESLRAADKSAIDRVEQSNRTAAHYYWIPGTKVVGLLDFAGNRAIGGNGEHGHKAASVAVGARHGACPACLLVFLSFDDEASGEAALEWALAQPWIDAVSGSFGFSSTGRYRDRLYSGSDVAAQRVAAERGQTLFFSAGNGLENDFTAPNSTWFSSQEGPDWVVTVAAVAPDGADYSGAGKPADVAGPGDGYPSAGGTTVAGESTFGGTSNATPVVAGTYAEALRWVRARLPGPSQTQEHGVVATGAPVPCGPARTACELSDGALTAPELRTRLFLGAIHTPAGLVVPASPPRPELRPPGTAEEPFLAEGHGTFWGRLAADPAAELTRVTAPMDGSAAPIPRPEGEADWFTVDSYCRQQIWLPWTGGDWVEGAPLPLPDPRWPLRTALAATCGPMFPPLQRTYEEIT